MPGTESSVGHYLCYEKGPDADWTAVAASTLDRSTIKQTFRQLARGSILNIHGLHGYGKSSCLQFFLADAVLHKRIVAAVDFHDEQARSEQEALPALAQQLRSQGVRLPRFDTAHAAMVHRHNAAPMLDSRRAERWQGSLIHLEELFPGQKRDISKAKHLTSLLKVIRDELHERYWSSKELRQLEFEGPETIQALIRTGLSRDITACDKPVILLFDHYESLRHDFGALSRSAWLRDLLRQVGRNTRVAITSTSPIDWGEVADRGWAQKVVTVPITTLPNRDALALLNSLNVPSAFRDEVARQASHVPIRLEEIGRHVAQFGLEPDSEAPAPNEHERRAVLDYLGNRGQELLSQLSLLGSFDKQLFTVLRTAVDGIGDTGDVPTWAHVGRPYFERIGDGNARLHDYYRNIFLSELESNQATTTVHAAVYTALTDHDPEGYPLERVLHGLISGSLSETHALDQVDDAAPSADERTQLVASLTEFDERSELTEVIDTIGERALLDHGMIREILDREPLPQGSSPSLDRRLLTRAHAIRISGSTQESEKLYSNLRFSQTPSVQREASLWLADISMVLGRFDEALTLTGPEVADSDDVRRHRLRHLTHRFSFEFEEAETALASALQQCNGDRALQTELRVNELELHAWSTPQEALQSVPGVLESVHELGSAIEIGKAHTASVWASLGSNDLETAREHCEKARSILQAARYRSGLGRLYLVQAALSARQDQLDSALHFATRSAVQLFKRADKVYPTMVLMAWRLAERIGRPEANLQKIASNAIGDAELVCPSVDGQFTHLYAAEHIERGISTVLGQALDDNLEELHATVIANSSDDNRSGYYNINVRLEDTIVRSPDPEADDMDLKVWPEHQVLWAAHRAGLPVPRLLAKSTVPDIQLHEFIPGETLHNRYGDSLPDSVAQDLGKFLASLAAVPKTSLAAPPAHWPRDGDTASFAQQLTAKTQAIHAAYQPQFASLWRCLNFPEDPLANLYLTSLQSRSFQLIHCDLHHHNVISRATRNSENNDLVIIDWELALWGDPVYDLAVHLHKMRYTDRQEKEASEAWLDELPPEATDDWEADLRAYRAHEQVKSALVDSVRYTKEIAGGLPEDAKQQKAAALAAKVNAAYEVWEVNERMTAYCVLDAITASYNRNS